MAALLRWQLQTNHKQQREERDRWIHRDARSSGAGECWIRSRPVLFRLWLQLFSNLGKRGRCYSSHDRSGKPADSVQWAIMDRERIDGADVGAPDCGNGDLG